MLISLLVSCNFDSKKEKSRISNKDIKVDNVSETISTDIELLGSVLDFSIHRPTQVQFKYVYIDNSSQNERLSVPGPSDYYLEAILYFDDKTFSAINAFERNLEWMEQNHNKQEFDFAWLPKSIKEELTNHNSENYKGHPDFFFGTGVHGKAWYLENKILLQEYTN